MVEGTYQPADCEPPKGTKLETAHNHTPIAKNGGSRWSGRRASKQGKPCLRSRGQGVQTHTTRCVPAKNAQNSRRGGISHTMPIRYMILDETTNTCTPSQRRDCSDTACTAPSAGERRKKMRTKPYLSLTGAVTSRSVRRTRVLLPMSRGTHVAYHAPSGSAGNIPSCHHAGEFRPRRSCSRRQCA